MRRIFCTFSVEIVKSWDNIYFKYVLGDIEKNNNKIQHYRAKIINTKWKQTQGVAGYIASASFSGPD